MNVYTKKIQAACSLISHMKIYEMALLASDLPYFFGMG